MCGPMIVTDAKLILNEGISQGISQGENNRLTEDLINITKELNCSVERAMDILKVPDEKREQLKKDERISKLVKMTEQ